MAANEVWLIEMRNEVSKFAAEKDWYVGPNAGIFMNERDALWTCREMKRDEKEAGWEFRPVKFVRAA